MRKIAISLTVVMLFACACSARSDTAGQRSRLGTPEAAAGAQGSEKQGGRAKKDKGDKDAGGQDLPATGKGGVGGVAAGSESLPEEIDVPGADEEQTYPKAFAEITEETPDAEKEGITPDYGEVLGVSFEGLGDELRVTMTFNGEVPQQMPNDKTIMVVGLQIIRGKDQGYGFAGQATDEGWKPYAGGKDKATKFPGKFEVSGNTVVMEIRWSYLDGAYPFKWLATSSWFQSIADTTHYIFDLIPNKDQSNYPG